MRTGIIISGLAHLGLILWMLFGGMFLRPHDAAPLQVSQVSIISPDEFQALTAGGSTAPQAPQTSVQAPKPAPKPDLAPKETPKPEARPKEAAPKAPETAPKPDDAPKVAGIQPLPQAKVSDNAPAPPSPPKEDQPAILVPKRSDKEKVIPVPRVAPMPAPKPEEGAKISKEVQKSAAPEASKTAEVKRKAKEAKAPKAAATEIATEANKADENAAPPLAPKTSPRPEGRPQRVAKAEPPKKPAPPKKPETKTPETKKPDQKKPDDSVDAAVAAALASAQSSVQSQAKSAPQMGNGMTPSEIDGLRRQIRQCWNVDLGSEAANVTVTVAFSLNQDGTVVSDSLRQVSATGGSDSAVQAAYDAARRAIYRCGADGYKLPPGKYDEWRNVEIEFNPDKMRLK